MWECKKCDYKNSNSNLTCHGKDCDGRHDLDSKIKIEKHNEKKIKPKKINRIYDYCPVHKCDVVLEQRRYKGKIAWECTKGYHRLAILKGKSKPFPEGLLEELERQDELRLAPKINL